MQHAAGHQRLASVDSNCAALNSSTVSSFSPKKYSTPAVLSDSGLKTNWTRALLMPENTPAVPKSTSATIRAINSVFSPLTEDESTPPPNANSSLDEMRHKRALSAHSMIRLDRPQPQKFLHADKPEAIPSTAKLSKSGSNKENSSFLSATNRLLTENITIRSKMFADDQKTLSPLSNRENKSNMDRSLQTDNVPCKPCVPESDKESVPHYSDSLDDSPPTHHCPIDALKPDYVRPIIEECFEELDDRFRFSLNGFYSQVLCRLDSLSDKMDSLIDQKATIEKLTRENERLKSLVDKLEALRYGK